jgi:DNA-directed RNA polymerase sigma subunit (sigma70/sigma32)
MTSTGLDTYLNEIGRLPVLTEESQLLHCRRIHAWVQWPGGRDNAPERIRRIGRRSMDVMITTNLRLVVSITRRYLNRGMELEDLIQEGNIGLARGLELFDPTRAATGSPPTATGGCAKRCPAPSTCMRARSASQSTPTSCCTRPTV